MEYTQEQVDAMIQEKIKEVSTGLYTEDDLKRKVTAEVDRRVQSGIDKGIETQRAKWEKEWAEQSKLSAEELAKKQFESKMDELTSKEKEIAIKANKINAMESLSSAEIPKDHYSKFLDILVNDDEQVTSQNVSNFVEMFNSTKKDLETTLKEQMSHINPPKSGTGSSDDITIDKFKEMTYAEKQTVKQENPELFNKFIKQ